MSDFTIDWDMFGSDATRTLLSGNDAVTVSVSTPHNAEGKEWFVENGMLKNWDVTTNSSADIRFNTAVTDVKFTLLDVDALDKITIMTKDADGNPVPVVFEVTGVHDVNGNTVTGTQTNAAGPGADNGGQDIEVCIPGPLTSFWIVLDNGPERAYSGTVAVSDITFSLPAELDGYVDGTSGNDVIDANYLGDPDGDRVDANDQILPGEGAQDDVILAGNGNDFVLAGAGNDEVYGGAGHDTLCGQDGDDTLYGGTGNDTLEGMEGNDLVFGQDGNDKIYGDAGNDVLVGGLGDDKIFGGSGDDVAHGGKGTDTIDLGAGNDVAFGGAGGDSILGGDGNDTITGGGRSFDGTINFNNLAAGDLVDGQYLANGVHIYSADPRNPMMIFDSANPTGGDTDLRTTNLGKVLILSEDRDGTDPDDNAGGGTFVFEFDGPAYVRSLDFLDIEGGAWIKLYDMNGNLIRQIDTAKSADNGQLHQAINVDGVVRMEVIIKGSGAIDNLSYKLDGEALDGADVISGGNGDDKIFGGAGDDTLSGDAGADRLEGGNGNDTLFGGDDRDVIFGGAGNDKAFGGNGNDEIWMGSGDDMAEGGAGNDWMHGQTGNDMLSGDAGDDMLFGEAGNDMLFGGDGNDVLDGGAGDDKITGGAGVDTIKGGDDRDTIFGDHGDIVDGGAGGHDFDVLDLTGKGPFYLDNVTTDSNGNGINGTVVFVDADGNPTGSTIVFTEIEQVIGDEVNRGPVAVDDTATTDEDTTVTIDVLGNDTDPDGDTLMVTGASSPDGDVVINADGTITFTPAPNFNGDATITYDIKDGNGGTATATVTVHVTPVNDAPDAVDDNDMTDEDTPVTIDLLANDTDVDGDTLTVTNVSVPAGQGTIVNNGDGTVTFTPAPNFTGTAMISYDVTDGNGGRDWAKHFVEVKPVNDGPVAVDDAATTDEDTAVTINVLGNDTDADGDTLMVTGATSPDGDVVVNADGTITFTPNANFNRDATITYDIKDGNGGTATATVTVHVTPVNDAPDAVDDMAATDEDTAVTISVLDNDTDPDGDELTIIRAVSPNGTVVINDDGTLTFTPDEGFHGMTTVDYVISDGNGGTDKAWVKVTVNSVNDDPDAVDNAYVVTEEEVSGDTDGNAITDDTGAGLDSDPDGDALTVIAVNGNPALVGVPVPATNGGLITVNADGSVDFDANGEFEALGDGDSATTAVTYTVSDGNGGTDTATITFTVNGVNDGPVAVDNDYVVTLNEGAGDTDGNVLTDNTGKGVDRDPENDTLKVVGVGVAAGQVGAAVAGSNGGLFTILEDGTVDFDANGDFTDLGLGDTATTSVEYTISDGNGGFDTATATFTVTGINDGTVQGTNGNDIIIPGYVDANGDIVDGDDAILPGDTGNDDLIYGFDGDDQIRAGDGNDEVFGGAGNDSLYGDAGNDTLSGDDGDDIVFGGAGDDTLIGGAGNDLLEGAAGADVIFGGAGDDDIWAGSGEDSVQGGAGNDIIDGGGQNDILLGGSGNDTIFGGNGDDRLFGGPGDDIIEGGTGNDLLTGGDGNDTLSGGEGDDRIFGSEGNDVLNGNAGNDIVEGSEGNDTLFGGDGDDDLWGGLDNDTVFGGAGDDTVAGEDGDDTLFGGAGNDTAFGGAGNDIIDTSKPGADALPDVGYPGVYGADTNPNNDKDVVFGGAGDDTITTGDDDDSIFGGEGNDVINAGWDDDYVEGNEGDDTIIGDEGNDEIYGGAGNDLIFGGLDDSFPDVVNIPDDGTGPFGPDLVTNNNNDTLFGGDGDDRIFGRDDDDTLYGDAGNDYLDGGVDDDELYGGDGDDTLIGGQGNDQLFGGFGSDTFIGGNGGDVVVGGEDPDDSDIDVLDLTGSNVDFITYTSPDREEGIVTFLNGSTMTFAEIETVIPCFTPGTTIATPKGERLVEELEIGDRIITRDNGIQEIAWVGHKHMAGKQLVQNPHLRPILIKAGSLGHGLPERDMLVSPNHRVLVASEMTQLYFEETEVLAAAKHMIGTPGIHAVDVMQTTYIHFMFERHEVVLSNGAWTESFQPGDYTLKGIGNSQRNEILELFPELATKTGLEGYQSARKALKKHEAKLLLK